MEKPLRILHRVARLLIVIRIYGYYNGKNLKKLLCKNTSFIHYTLAKVGRPTTKAIGLKMILWNLRGKVIEKFAARILKVHKGSNNG